MHLKIFNMNSTTKSPSCVHFKICNSNFYRKNPSCAHFKNYKTKKPLKYHQWINDHESINIFKQEPINGLLLQVICNCLVLALISLFSKSIAHDFSNGVFYFQNKIDADLPMWQRQKWVVSNSQGQDTQTNIMAKRDREGVFRGSSVNNHQTSRRDC